MPKARPRRLPPHRGPRPRRRPSRGGPPPVVVEQPAPPPLVLGANGRAPVTIPSQIQVGELAELLESNRVDVIRSLVNLGMMVTINQSIDFETASLVANEMGYEVLPEPVAQAEPEASDEAAPGKEVLWTDEDEDQASMKPRPPVVTVIGHVDHGKTSLLDAIRSTNVTAREAGGITQHIGAYQIEHNGRKVTFLDTPGHEAFTAMRARGAQVTDVAILVVAADDGVQPQTVEAIAHLKAAAVPVVVALNKIDKADGELAKSQLAEHGVTIEEYGGDTPLVPVSARTKQGISDLIEVVLLVADVADLKANPDRPAIGRVIEAHLDKGKGPVATVLVQTGTLKRGDLVVAGTIAGRIRAMVDDKGKPVGRAEPSRPVEIQGLPAVPEAGEVLRAVADEKESKALVARNARERGGPAAGERATTLDELFANVKEGKTKELKLILKADVQGSLEAIKGSLAKIPTDEVGLNVIHDGVGDVSESDVNLAVASGAVVIAFNNKVDVAAKRVADQSGVDIRQYKVIYELLDEVQKAITGMLEPEMVEASVGHAEVRAIFTANKTTIAGCMVVDGTIRRNAKARLLRAGEAIYDGSIATLRRVKDDVREVNAGFECGIVLDGHNDVQVGDLIECYVVEAKPR
ncbi:MAG TPA: translation initiation factor IF-2 [Candidatus Limnocylindria bacterium]|nr:translation initiation factor IF-2 [Candidatus Limnocylindria bacterium]